MQSDQRKKLEEENQAMLQERLESLKLEVEQEKAELRVRYLHRVSHIFIVMKMQLKITQGETYKLEESVKMETELIDLRAERNMMSLQVSYCSHYCSHDHTIDHMIIVLLT